MICGLPALEVSGLASGQTLGTRLVAVLVLRSKGSFKQLPASHNAILFFGGGGGGGGGRGSLHRNDTSYLPLRLYHASVNWISIVLMQITSQNELYHGSCENRELLIWTITTDARSQI